MCSYIVLIVLFILSSCKHFMPQNVGNLTQGLDQIPEDECKHIPLNFPWTITSKHENLTVTRPCLNWTFNYDICVRVTTHPQGAPNNWKQINLHDHHPLLRSLTDALNNAKLSLSTIWTPIKLTFCES